VPGDWHLVHLGSRAVGGAGLVIAEATSASPDGRITPGCTGLWNDAQRDAWRRIVERFIASKVTPLADFPESYLAVVHDAFVELHVALKAEERRSVDEARSKPRGPAMSTKIGGRK